MKKIITILLLFLIPMWGIAQGNCQAYFNSQIEADSSISLFDLSYNTDSTQIDVVSWEWRIFGGVIDQTFTNQSPSNVNLDVFATYFVELDITTSDSCTSTYFDSIVYFRPPDTCSLEFQFIQTPASGDSIADGAINSVNLVGTAPFHFFWASGGEIISNSSMLENVPSGQYFVAINDAVGCSYMVGVYLAACNISASANIHPEVYGSDGSINMTPSGGTPPYQYQWMTNGTFVGNTQDINYLQEGFYNVVITDAYNCTYQDSFFVYSVSPPPVPCHAEYSFSYDSTNSVISFQDLSVVDTSEYITSWTWYLEYNGLVQTSALQNPGFDVYGSGLSTFCLTIETSASCTSQECDTIMLIGPACNLSASIDVTQISVIGGNDGAINITTSGGVPPYSFLWNNGETTEDIYGLTSGLFEVTISDSSYCAAIFVAAYIYEPYDTAGGVVVDTLSTGIIDTCFNFTVDSFYIEHISVDDVNMTVTVTWAFVGNGMTSTLDAVYTFNSAGNYVVYLTINCGSKKALTTYMSYIHISPSMVGTAGTMESAETY
ncbi:MAG: SprB repeat-containing protein, partial [Bacteroidetes bacterium]|nr:SprB repeat-containing protein [Bacteroidota bacterium]